MKAVRIWNKRFCLKGSAPTNAALSWYSWGIAYDWDTEGHCVEGNGRDEHDNEDDPDIHKHGCLEWLDEGSQGKLYQRVRLPTSPASW